MTRILIVESGTRDILEAAIPGLRRIFGDEAALHLLTCQPGTPQGLTGAIWRTQDHSDPAARATLLKSIKATQPTVLAIMCTGQPIMTRWKWWLAWKLPAKVLIVNENADCFWLDRSNLPTIRKFATLRLGLGGDDGARTFLRLAALPFIVIYLILYASVVHTRRRLRLLL